jgi:hypothetical protein
VLSIVQALLLCTAQQNPVSPLASATPAPQLSAESFCGGLASPWHE